MKADRCLRLHRRLQPGCFREEYQKRKHERKFNLKTIKAMHASLCNHALPSQKASASFKRLCARVCAPAIHARSFYRFWQVPCCYLVFTRMYPPLNTFSIPSGVRNRSDDLDGVLLSSSMCKRALVWLHYFFSSPTSYNHRCPRKNYSTPLLNCSITNTTLTWKEVTIPRLL